MVSRLFAAVLCLSLSVPGALAQDSPATREEVLGLFEAMQTRDMSRQVMQSVTAQMRAIAPPGASGAPTELSARLDALLDEMLAEYPMEEIMEDMVPVYQKHLSSDDVKAMVAFYSTPTGKKVLREMPSIMAESMEASQPRLQRHLESFNERIQQAIREMMEQLPGRPAVRQ